MNEHITHKVKELNNEYNDRKRNEENRVDKIKENIVKERGVIARIKDSLNKERRRIRKDHEEYKEELKNRLEREKQMAINNSIKKNTRIIRNHLKKEFTDKLKLELKSKEAEFEKKKEDLALDVQKKAKELFG